MARFREWGLSNIALEKWGPWGRAWTLKRFTLHMVEPQYQPMIGYPLAWSDSTKGVTAAELLLVPVRDSDMERLRADIDRVKKEYTGKLKGKVLLMTAMKPLRMQTQAAARRYTDAELSAQTLAPEPAPSREFDYSKLWVPEETEERYAFYRNAPRGYMDALRVKRTELRNELHEFLRKEGAAGIFTTDMRGDGGTVFGESAGWHEAKYPSPLPSIALTPEHYNRLARLIEKKTPVKVEFEVSAVISPKDREPTNVIAEIPGGSKAGEVVIVGAHLDSWHAATGATDNATGCAVAMEAMRILKALNVKLDRTVRVALWSGEEQGLLGSKEYVKRHFADIADMKPKAEHDKLSVYLNLDNGGGKIRGVYLQSNDAARPVFERWLAPFRDLGVTTVTIRNTGGTDHQSFDAVGLPAFQFIQDPLEYMSRTHHSNMDTFDRVQAGDLMQASAVMASVIYHAANRPDMMPRKPLPEAEPEWKPPAK
jgi:hypothetical protein